ncbi:MAG: hypothetical protein GYA55_08520, partial [SAR324 cluster bacterium]|nr:hypothetical protein [SAR324 cluster bacterium]
ELESISAEATLNHSNEFGFQSIPHLVRGWRLLGLICEKYRDQDFPCEKMDSIDALQNAILSSELVSIPPKKLDSWLNKVNTLFNADYQKLAPSSQLKLENLDTETLRQLCDELENAIQSCVYGIKKRAGKTLAQVLKVNKIRFAALFLVLIALFYILPSLVTGYWNPLLWLKPKVGPFTIAYSSQQWGKLQINQSVESRPLSIGKVSYQKGLGTHAHSKIKLLLPDTTAVLKGACGVDDEVGEKGSVTCQILADEKVLWESSLLKGGMPAQSFEIPLQGLNEIELRGTDGGDNIDSDHFDWVNLELE